MPSYQIPLSRFRADGAAQTFSTGRAAGAGSASFTPNQMSLQILRTSNGANYYEDVSGARNFRFGLRNASGTVFWWNQWFPNASGSTVRMTVPAGTYRIVGQTDRNHGEFYYARFAGLLFLT